MSSQGFIPIEAPVRMVALEIDGHPVKVREGQTILDACRSAAIETPTLCFATNLTPVNACRVCVVELEGARVLVPACARKAEPGMKVKTDSARVRHSRKLVLEFLASSVDLSTASAKTHEWIEKLKKKGVKVEGKDLSRTQIINLVADLLEPGKDGKEEVMRPMFVTDYFAELSPLARRNPKNPLLSERFELYIGGMEIANGYSEQNNPIEQKQRFEEELQEKGKAATNDTIDHDFIYALEHGMPPAGGLGIGIDRLVMVLTDQPSIREVVLFPQMKPEKL